MKFKIKEIAEFNIASLSTKNMPSTIHYLETSNITNGITDEIIILNVGSDKIPSRARRIVETNDIIYSTVRPNQRHFGFITEELRHLTVSTGFTVIKPNIEYVNPYYLYCYLTTDNITDMLQSIAENSTTAYPSIKASDIGNLTIELPSLSEQNYIVDLIMNLNKKLKNNLKIIKNLEQLSQTLFKNWFIDFEFPNEQGQPYKSSGGEMVESELGEIPKGWKINSLDKIANYQNGLAMQKYRPMESEKKSLPVLKIKELNQGFTDVNSDRCSINIKDSVKVLNGDVIFSWSGTLLVKLWTGGEAGLNQHLFKVTSCDFQKWFYYLWTKHYLTVFQARAAEKATTMGHIKRAHLEEAKAVIPKLIQLEVANKTFEPIIEQIIALGIENKKLQELRDTLLPKLLSGEIEIPDELEVK